MYYCLFVRSAFDLEREREWRQKENALKVQIAQLEATLKADLGEKGGILDKLSIEKGKNSISPLAFTNEPPHDKTNKMTVRPAKTQISLGICPVWSESSLHAYWVAKDRNFLHADSEDSDQTGRMPRLIWVFPGRTCHFVSFVMRRFKQFYTKLQNLWACIWSRSSSQF